MNWEPALRTEGRTLGGDVHRILTLGNPRRTLYRNAHYLTATVEVDAERMRRWLPAGIRLAEPARADVFAAFFPDCNFGSVYHEAGVFVHIATGRTTGIHCPWMIVDDDVALIMGREMLGYPKKLGEIDWQQTGTEISATAARRGTTLISMSGRLGRTVSDEPPFLGRPHRNVVGLLGLFLPWVVAFTPAETPIEVRRIDDVQLEIGGGERDPLDQMGFGRVIDAHLHRVDLSATMLPIPVRPLTPLFTATRLRPRVL